MSPLRVRRRLRRSHRRLFMILALLGVTGAFVLHHDVPMDMHDMPMGAVCVAVLAIGATAAIGIALVTRPGPWRTSAAWAPTTSRPAEPRGVPARAGPLHLQLLVIRR